jgi:hypothetical protein
MPASQCEYVVHARNDTLNIRSQPHERAIGRRHPELRVLIHFEHDILVDRRQERLYQRLLEFALM